MNKIKELMLKGCSRIASAKNAMANNVADENVSKVAWIVLFVNNISI